MEKGQGDFLSPKLRGQLAEDTIFGITVTGLNADGIESKSGIVREEMISEEMKDGIDKEGYFIEDEILFTTLKNLDGNKFNFDKVLSDLIISMIVS